MKKSKKNKLKFLAKWDAKYENPEELKKLLTEKLGPGKFVDETDKELNIPTNH